jgi:hypothetical protein
MSTDSEQLKNLLWKERDDLRAKVAALKAERDAARAALEGIDTMRTASALFIAADKARRALRDSQPGQDAFPTPSPGIQPVPAGCEKPAFSNASGALKVMGTPPREEPCPTCGEVVPLAESGAEHRRKHATPAATPAAPMCRTCGGDGVCRCDYCIEKGRTDEPCPACQCGSTNPTPPEETPR